MNTSLYLAQIIGLYLVLVGLIMMMRRRYFMAAVKEFVHDKALLFVIPIVELLAGLALVVAHNIWVWSWEVIITITGWLMVIEALSYLVLPEKTIVKWISWFNKDKVYFFGGIASVAFGLYLVLIGFDVRF